MFFTIICSFKSLERYKNGPFTILNEVKRLLILAKSGTSVYMDRDILRWIDEKVKERVYRNRSHAVEYAVAQLMKMDPLKRHGY